MKFNFFFFFLVVVARDATGYKLKLEVDEFA